MPIRTGNDRRAPRGRLLSRFRRDRKGATAVEFAMIALPFFALLFTLIETALIMWSSQLLETGVADAARKLYTGQFQQGKAGSTSVADFQKAFIEELCVGKDSNGVEFNRLPLISDCKNTVKVDVRSNLAGFSDATRPTAKNPTTGKFDTAGFTFQCPRANEIVLVTAAVPYKVIVAPNANMWSNLADGYRLLMASAAFRAEPFGPVCQ